MKLRIWQGRFVVVDPLTSRHTRAPVFIPDGLTLEDFS
jgi:hypothetical protein